MTIGLAVALLAATALRYEVAASAGARELSIEARIPAFPDRDGELSVAVGAEPFVRDVMLLSPEGAVRLERRGDSWFAPGCATHGCRIRYRFALREAATASGDEDLAVLYGEIVESPPGAWLLRPLRVPAAATAEIWSGGDTALAQLLEDCFLENRIPYRRQGRAPGNLRYYVLPSDEPAAREIIREVSSTFLCQEPRIIALAVERF